MCLHDSCEWIGAVGGIGIVLLAAGGYLWERVQAWRRRSH